MTLVDASNETNSLVLVGDLVGWGKKFFFKKRKWEGKKQRINYARRATFVRSA